jgi:hypothetical protein
MFAPLMGPRTGQSVELCGPPHPRSAQESSFTCMDNHSMDSARSSQGRLTKLNFPMFSGEDPPTLAFLLRKLLRDV